MVSKILVVDDEPDLEILFKEKFRKKIKSKEFEFVFARNGIEALKKLEENQDLHIVLTDLNMPEKDGLTLLADLQKVNRLIKTVVVSAYGDMDNIRCAMNQGAFDFVIKPIDFLDLEKTISRTFEQYYQTLEAQENKKKLSDLEKELDIARQMQQSMLPQNIHLNSFQNSVDLYAKMIPAKEIGGDFYDFFIIDKDHMGLMIADVSGKNIVAALLMSISKTLLHSIAIKGVHPQEVLKQVNQILNVDNERSMFVTAFYAILNVHTGELTYCNAGQPPPFLLSSDGTYRCLGKGEGFPLGICENETMLKINPYIEQKVLLKPNDCLVLYTDGIIEAKNSLDELYSLERLEDLMKSLIGMNASEISQALLEDNKRFVGTMPQSDDITLLTLNYKGLKQHDQ